MGYPEGLRWLTGRYASRPGERKTPLLLGHEQHDWWPGLQETRSREMTDGHRERVRLVKLGA